MRFWSTRAPTNSMELLWLMSFTCEFSSHIILNHLFLWPLQSLTYLTQKKEKSLTYRENILKIINTVFLNSSFFFCFFWQKSLTIVTHYMTSHFKSPIPTVMLLLKLLTRSKVDLLKWFIGSFLEDRRKDAYHSYFLFAIPYLPWFTVTTFRGSKCV